MVEGALSKDETLDFEKKSMLSLFRDTVCLFTLIAYCYAKYRHIVIEYELLIVAA